MQVKNSNGDRALLRILGENRFAADRSAARLATGMKITCAKDDSAAYAISEKMRVRLRGLERDRRNSENGRALLRTAEGGLARMTELVKQMKGLAVQSANGIYTDEDRRIMDAEYQHCIQQMDDIASTTNHNGRYLLDGSLTVREGQGSAVLQTRRRWRRRPMRTQWLAGFARSQSPQMGGSRFQLALRAISSCVRKMC